MIGENLTNREDSCKVGRLGERSQNRKSPSQTGRAGTFAEYFQKVNGDELSLLICSSWL